MVVGICYVVVGILYVSYSIWCMVYIYIYTHLEPESSEREYMDPRGTAPGRCAILTDLQFKRRHWKNQSPVLRSHIPKMAPC